MKFGNSKGNNTGKKYFMRNNAKPKATAEGKAQAEDFGNWFTRTYDSLVTELRRKQVMDADMMNETFLKMYDNMLYNNLKVKDYRSYFSRAYFTNSVQSKIREKRYSTIDYRYDVTDNEPYDEALDYKQRELAEEVFDYVYDRYDVREFEIFKMYMSLKPAVNYTILSEMTHLRVHTIQSAISKIKKDVCSNPWLVQRRKDLSY